jgi:O-methyltransferase involved in polyketide biosynthesis
MDKKVKPILNGAAETMLQSFYARAQYSKKKHHKIYDAKAVDYALFYFKTACHMEQKSLERHRNYKY